MQRRHQPSEEAAVWSTLSCWLDLAAPGVRVWGHGDTLILVLRNLITLLETNEKGRSRGLAVNSLSVLGRQTPGAFAPRHHLPPWKDTWVIGSNLRLCPGRELLRRRVE